MRRGGSRDESAASGDAGAAGGCGAAAQVATFVFAGSTPDSAVLVSGHRELKALFAHGAVRAHLAGAQQHAHCLASVADREEELRVGVAAIGVHPPGIIGGTKSEALSKDRHSGNTLSVLGALRKGFLNYFRGDARPR